MRIFFATPIRRLTPTPLAQGGRLELCWVGLSLVRLRGEAAALANGDLLFCADDDIIIAKTWIADRRFACEV